MQPKASGIQEEGCSAVLMYGGQISDDFLYSSIYPFKLYGLSWVCGVCVCARAHMLRYSDL